MRKLLLLIGAGLALLCACDAALGQWGGANGKAGPYEKYDMGQVNFSAGDSLILPADTDWRITYLMVVPLGASGDSLVARYLKRQPHAYTDISGSDHTAGSIASTDELFVFVSGAGKSAGWTDAIADTLILRGEIADAVEWSYFVGYSSFSGKHVGSAP